MYPLGENKLVMCVYGKLGEAGLYVYVCLLSQGRRNYVCVFRVKSG